MVLGLLSTTFLLPAAADHDDGVYELPSYANWDHGDLSVLIVGPVHGQIYNADAGVLNGGDPNELTPFNSYLEAIEAAIAEWNHAVEMLGADWLKDVYEPSVYVLGRDSVPPDVLASPDILVITDENEGPSLGTSIWAKTGHVRTPCVVRMSSSWIGSFSYADMYNVTAQEFGHCLGLNHVGSQAGVDPTSDLKHPEHDVMNGFYTHNIGEPDTHLHCVSNLDVLALEHVFDYEMAYSAVLNLGVEGVTYMTIDAYGDTCVPPRADWRSVTPPTMLPGAPSMGSAIRKPLAGSDVQAAKFKRVAGSAQVDESLQNVDFEVEIALARIADDGSCEWWDRDSESFVVRDCYSPMWRMADAGRDSWFWEAPRDLSTGSYRALSRVVSEYGNEACCDKNMVDFRLIRHARGSS